MVSTTAVTTEILNALLSALSDVLPQQIERDRPTLFSGPVIQQEMGVLIGLTGVLPGRLFLYGASAVFSGLAEKMYGMKLTGDMLESFVGELGNMIGGNLCSHAATADIHLEITPPTVIIGETKLSGFSTAIRLPVQVQEVGRIDTILALSDKI